MSPRTHDVDGPYLFLLPDPTHEDLCVRLPPLTAEQALLLARGVERSPERHLSAHRNLSPTASLRLSS